MSQRPWYKRYPADFISATMHMTAEQKGAYSVLIDLLAMRGSPLPDESVSLARLVGCSTRRWNQLRQQLIGLNKIKAESGFLDVVVNDATRPCSERPTPEHWAALRKIVFERDGYVCQYCGTAAERLECDHVIPVAQGGSSELGNLTTACAPCNRQKGARTPQEWLQ